MQLHLDLHAIMNIQIYFICSLQDYGMSYSKLIACAKSIEVESEIVLNSLNDFVFELIVFFFFNHISQWI